MRLLQWALLGLTGVLAADSNTTKESRNILTSSFTPPKHFRNVNLVRNINLEKSYPRETINVVIENVDKQAQSEYFIPFEQDLIGRVGGLDVKDKKQPERTGFKVDVVGIVPFR
jgi:oligosaccharyltransferase complex subunit alpha (ribophorin I)